MLVLKVERVKYPKARVLTVLCVVVSFVLASLPQTTVIAQEENGDINFQANSIPWVDTYYEDYSFVFNHTESGRFIRIRPFVLSSFYISQLNPRFINSTEYNYTGYYYGMRAIVEFIRSQYPNVNYTWLIDKAIHAIHYGFNWTNLPQNVAANLDYLGFRLVDLNFPLSWFELEIVPIWDEVNSAMINVTYIKIPRANLVFSFEDLYPYGYSIEHVNSTYVLIGNVQGRTDLYVDPITYSSPTVTVTGGSQGSPLTFKDIYDADLAGTFRLDARHPITTTDADWVLVTNILQPASADSLGGVAHDLWIEVFGWLPGMTSSTISLRGEDRAGVQLIENITVTGNGIYYTVESFANLVFTQVVAFSGTSSFGYNLDQGQWGVVYKQSGYWLEDYEDQFTFKANLQIGDGSTTTWFKDTEKAVQIGDDAAAAYWLQILNGNNDPAITHFQLGNDGTPPQDGGYLYLYFPSGDRHWSGDIQLYGVNIIRTGGRFLYLGYYSGSTIIIKYCNLELFRPILYRSHIWERSNFIDSRHGLESNFVATSINDIRVEGGTYIFELYFSTSVTVNNLYGRGNTYVAFGDNPSFTGNLNLVNPDIDSWSFYWESGSTGKVYRQYEFDLRVTYPNGTAFQNANVTITYEGQGGGTVGSWLTNSTGQIPSQVLTRSFYNQTGGNTEYVYYPYVLNITSSYGNYSKEWTPNVKTTWEIALTEISGNGAVAFDSSYFLLGVITFLPSLLLILKRRKRNGS